MLLRANTWKTAGEAGRQDHVRGILELGLVSTEQPFHFKVMAKIQMQDTFCLSTHGSQRWHNEDVKRY